MKKFLPVLLLTLVLAACGQNRAAMDEKLAAACLAGVRALSEPGDVFDVKEKTFASAKSHEDTNLRIARLRVYYTHNGGAIEEKNYSCAFEEISGLFGYAPRFQSLDKAGEKYGNVDGVIEGGLENLMKIQQAMGPSFQ